MIISAHRASLVIFNFLKSKSQEGRLWLLPANVCTCVPDTFRAAGVDFQFVDIDAHSLCIDRQVVLSNAYRISGLLYVHSYGVNDVPDDFFAELKSINPDMLIIDDRCLCVPSNSMVGLCSDLELYSVGEKKYVDLGFGGYAFVSDSLGKCYRDFPSEVSWLRGEHYEFDSDAIMQKISKVQSHKQSLNHIYSTLLPASIQFPEDYQRWRFNISVDNQKQILDALFADGLYASAHYSTLESGHANATYLANHVVNLFNDFYYTEQQARRTCKIINQLL